MEIIVMYLIRFWKVDVTICIIVQFSVQSAYGFQIELLRFG